MSDQESDKLWQQLPTSFGKVEEDPATALAKRYRLALREEFETNQRNKSKTAGSDDDSDSDSDNDDDDELPISHELVIKAHSKPVSSISLDSSGSRAVTASYDTFLNYWDFNGMDMSRKAPFRSSEPLETHQLRTASFSPLNDNAILVVPRFTKPKIFSREGQEVSEFVAGDMYLVDMNNTKGHTAEMTHGCWSPSERNMFATSALDSTVRIWDTDNTRSQKNVIVLRSKGGRGNKVRVSTLGFSGSGANIVAGTAEGSIGLWSSKGPFLRPSQFVENAHESESIVSLVSGPDDFTLASRGSNGSIKLWDTRQFKSPVMSRATPLPCGDMEACNSLSFDPTGQYLLAGSTGSELHVLDKSDLTSLQTLHLGASSSVVTSVTWHSRLNQIFAGLSDGSVHALFSPELSTKGAKLVVEKAPKKRFIDDNTAATTNISAVGLEEGISRIQAEEEERKRASRKHKLEEGSHGAQPDPAAKNRLWGAPDQEHLKNNVPLSHMVSEDPREALLKYAERAKKDPRFKNFAQDGKDNDSHDEKRQKGA